MSQEYHATYFSIFNWFPFPSNLLANIILNRVRTFPKKQPKNSVFHCEYFGKKISNCSPLNRSLIPRWWWLSAPPWPTFESNYKLGRNNKNNSQYMEALSYQFIFVVKIKQAAGLTYRWACQTCQWWRSHRNRFATLESSKWSDRTEASPPADPAASHRQSKGEIKTSE